MKKIVFIFLILPLFLFAQKNVVWFSVAPRAGYGTSLFLHKESLNDNNVTYKLFSPSYFLGGRFGVTFGQYVNISFEATYNNFSQNWTIYNERTRKNFDETVAEKSADFSLFFRLNTNTGFFIETGGQISLPQEVRLYSPTNDFSEIEITPHFNSFYPEAAFALGIMPYISQTLEISIGSRFNYAFNVLSDDFFLTSNYFINRNGNYTDPTLNHLRMFVFIDINYVFAYYGKAGCGKHRFIFNRNTKKLKRF